MTTWADLTPEEQSKVSNGCGGKGCFIPPLASFFDEACRPHDFRYSRGGFPLIFKLWADLVFLLHLLWLSVRFSWWRWVYRIPAAVAYFIAVDCLAGWFFWHWSILPRTKEEILS